MVNLPVNRVQVLSTVVNRPQNVIQHPVAIIALDLNIRIVVGRIAVWVSPVNTDGSLTALLGRPNVWTVCPVDGSSTAVGDVAGNGITGNRVAAMAEPNQQVIDPFHVD